MDWGSVFCPSPNFSDYGSEWPSCSYANYLKMAYPRNENLQLDKLLRLPCTIVQNKDLHNIIVAIITTGNDLL